MTHLHLLQPSRALISLVRRITFPSSSHQRRPPCCSMSSDSNPSSSLSHTLTLPIQPSEPVHIFAAPGVSDSHFRTAIDSFLFKQWLKNLQSETGILASGGGTLRRVLIQVPGIVFARGPAVAMLILLDSDEVTYAVLTEQPRVPVGRFVLELPAGMLDDDKGDFVGTAVREVEEETGIRLNLADMVDLTAFLYPPTGCRVFPSPGGCDEEIGIFLFRGNVDSEIIRQLQGKETGLRGRGELIKVHVVPYEKLWRTTADAKVLMAIGLYEMAKREGLLPLKS